MQKLVQLLKQHKLAAICVGAILLYLLFAYFAVNPLAKRAVPWAAQKYLGSHASVKSVAFDPLQLKTTIKGFKLTKKNGELLFAFDRLLVDLEASGIFDWAWKFKEITIQKPVANVKIAKDGELNWTELTNAIGQDKVESEKNTTIPRLIMDRIAIVKGEFDYEDASQVEIVQSQLSPIDLSLDGFSTLLNDSGAYQVRAVLPQQSGEIQWTGHLTVTPLVSNGTFALKQISLPKVLALVKRLKLPVSAKQGLVNLNFDYDFSLIKPTPQASQNDASKADEVSHNPTIKLVLNNAALQLHDLDGELMQASKLSTKLLKVEAPNIALEMQDATSLVFESLTAAADHITLAPLNDSSTPLLNLLHVAVNDVAFNLEKNQLNIGEVLLNQGVIHADKDQSGLLNWQAAFQTDDSETTDKAGETVVATTAPPSPDGSIAPSEEIQAESVAEVATENSETQPLTVNAVDEDASATSHFKLDVAAVKLNHWQADYNDQTYANPLSLNVNDINVGFSVALDHKGVLVDQLNSALNKITVNSTLFNKPVATLNAITLENSQIDTGAKKVDLSTIVASQLSTDVIQDKSKNINWQSILKPSNTSKKQPAYQQSSTQSQASPAVAKADDPWSFSLKKLSLNNTAIHIKDRVPETAMRLDIDKGALEVSNITDNLKQPLAVKLGFKVKQGGAFNARGTVRPAPFNSNLKLTLRDLSLKPFATYINQFAFLRLNDGATSLTGQLKLKQAKAMTGDFKGGFSVDNLAIVEEANKAPFLSWERVSSEDVAFNIAPNKLNVGHLTLLKPVGKFIIYEDKTMNITRMLRSASGNNTSRELPSGDEAETVKESIVKKVTKQAVMPSSNSLIDQHKNVKRDDKEVVAVASKGRVEAATEAFPIVIETTNIEDAELEFADLSLRPQFGAHMNTLSGVINGISTDAVRVAKVDLSGKVNEFGTAKINGALKPFNATDFTDMSLAFTNLDMHKLTPYSGKFAGRRIDSGKMSVDLAYKIKQHQLAGENKFVINQLKLGEKIESKDAADLPLDLAIAILEDNDGVIDLDLPISGNLDNPEFNFSGIAWKAFKNIMTKIVTAPFKVLGNLFGGKADGMEAINFEAGNVALQPPEQEKLKALSGALKKRSGLSLTITPHYVTSTDTRALQEEITRGRVLKEADLTSKVGETARPIDLDNEIIQAAVKSLHDDYTKKSLFKKIGDKLKKPEPSFYKKALEELIANTEVTDADLALLATQRAEAIKQYLVDADIDQARIIVNKPAALKDAKVIKASLAIGVNKPSAAQDNDASNP